MKIALDARPLCEPQPTGIPHYLRQVLRALAELDRDNEYVLYAHRDFAWTLPAGWTKRTASGIFGTLWMQAIVPAWLRDDRPDLFWGTQHTLPLFGAKRVPMALTVLDLMHRRAPETMRWRQYWVNRTLIEASIRRAQALAAISNHTKNDVLEFVPQSAGRIRVTPLGVEEHFKPMKQSDAWHILRPKHVVERPYLLTVGALEPKKNLATTLRAFAILAPEIPHDLLVAGPPGWKMRTVRSMRDMEPSVRERIKFLGYWPRESMPALYAGADLFLFPSLYEGFGLPPLEAIACGTPVVASNRASLPEVLGDGALYHDATDADAMAQHIRSLLQDAALRQSLSRKGVAQAAQYSWATTARETLAVLRSAVR